MPSPHDTDFEAAPVADHLAAFGESVTHRPKNNSAGDDTVTAIVELAEISEGDDGKRIQRGTLHVDDSLTVDARDAWRVRGFWFASEQPEPPEAGLIAIAISRPITRSTTSASRR